MNDYHKFLESKRQLSESVGFTVNEFNTMLFDFQKDIVHWALKKGRAAIFADCGMGKTAMQLEWAKNIPGRVLIVAPLAVSFQTCEESKKFGIEGVEYLRSDDLSKNIVVTNYEMLSHFDPVNFQAVVLDESSILKSFTGKYRNLLVNEWSKCKYVLAATATPAPNDYMELGSHAEFVGAMKSSEMLAAFFINDPSNVGRYTVKGHAEKAFWEWMASWSVMIRKPSDLGYDDGKFKLPKLIYHKHIVEPESTPDGFLFHVDAHTMSERQNARRNSLNERVNKVAEIANPIIENGDPVLIWCDRNDESDLLNKLIKNSVQVKGSDKNEDKVDRLTGFSTGKYQCLISKPTIAGWGMNWQHCNQMFFTGLSDSYEQFYQAVRRCWRFGQNKQVHCHIVTARTEGAVVSNIQKKEKQSINLAENIAKNMSYISKREVRNTVGFVKKYTNTIIKKPEL